MNEEIKIQEPINPALGMSRCYVQGGLQKRYSVIYADPAWSYDFKEPTASKGGAKGSGCANIAWNEIKDRTGVTVDNVFLKD